MTFSATLATRLAAASARAYADCTVSAQRTDAQALVTVDDDAVIVAFRGSKEIKDWIQDGKFWQSHTVCGCVHAGFNGDLQEILRPLLTATREALSRMVSSGIASPQFYVTGHSLGGALAQLFALACHDRFMHVSGVYTFGSPRVGDMEWAKTYGTLLGDRTFRVVNEYDLVPHLPLPGLLLRYWHTPSEVMLPLAGDQPVIGRSLVNHIFTDALMLWEARQLIRRPLALFENTAAEHSIETYRQHLSLLTSAPTT